MDADWDADDFEPPKPGAGLGDKWEGEDEDDNVKDNWEEEEEEVKKEESKDEIKAYQRPKKKSLADRIAEKEAKKKEGLDEMDQLQKPKEMTQEEKLAERLRLRKIQEDSDLKLAREAFGVADGATGIDTMYPVTDEEFDKLKDALKTKIMTFQKEKYYPVFIDKLFQEIAMEMSTEDLKKVSSNLSSLCHEKERQKKEQEKKKKKKVKAVIKVDRADDMDLFGDAAGDYYDEEFM